MNKFLEKFNTKYSDVLSENQRTLLTKYISSFSDNGLELKTYLNEEIGEIKSKINELAENKEVCDSQMKKSVDRVLEILDSHSDRPIDEEMLKDILKFQDLVKEMENHDNQH